MNYKVFSDLPQEIQAARLRLWKDRPYLASALFRLIPVEVEGLGTFGVDRRWRFYFDPLVKDKWSIEEITGVLYHEVCHLLLDHASRAESFGIKDFNTSENIGVDLQVKAFILNISGDLEINDDLKAESIPLPPDGATHERFKVPEGKFMEEYFEMLYNRYKDEDCPFCAIEEEMDKNSNKSKENKGKESGNGEKEEHSHSEECGSNGCNSQQNAQGESKGKKGGGGYCPKHTKIVLAPCKGNCGSGANGIRQPWELEQNTGNSEGIGNMEANLIRREVAQRIQEASRLKGDIPAGWKRWAENILAPPKVDWRKELASQIKSSISEIRGQMNFSYAKVSRRHSISRNIIFPAMVKPVVDVAVVIDTSGSMSDIQLEQCLSEIGGILKATGGFTGVRYLSVDAKVHAIKRVVRVSNVELLGGGGTDMTLGIETAAKLKPKPQIIVLLTDGYTDYPTFPPKGIKVIVGKIGGGDAPSWARVVDIEL